MEESAAMQGGKLARVKHTPLTITSVAVSIIVLRNNFIVQPKRIFFDRAECGTPDLRNKLCSKQI
jgi:hypothetical protein